MTESAKKFLKLAAFKAFLQEVADATGQETVLYNDDGLARMTLQGWPMRGKPMARATPSKVEHR